MYHTQYYHTEHGTEFGGPAVGIPYALLALLTEGPKYRLQSRQEFEAGRGEVWPLNVGQVYTTRQRLERDGLVESDGAGIDGPHQQPWDASPRLCGPSRPHG